MATNARTAKLVIGTAYVREEVPVAYERRRISVSDTEGQRLVRVWYTSKKHLTMRAAKLIMTTSGVHFEELMCQHPGDFEDCIAKAEERRRKWLRGMRDSDSWDDEGLDWEWDYDRIDTGGGMGGRVIMMDGASVAALRRERSVA